MSMKEKDIFLLKEPLVGLYNITRKSQTEWKVNITAQTDVDFDYFILEQYEDEYLYRISRNPIAGQRHIKFCFT